MLRLGTQIAIDDKECENVSQDGDPNCKRRRTREVTFPIPKMPATTNSSMSGNFKTHLCSNFRMGHCSYGNRCVFAHGIGEMRKRLPNMPGTWNGDYKMEEQSKFCRMFYFRKECSYGDNCRFLHANPDNSKQGMGYFRENSSITIGSRGFSGMQRSGYGISKPVIKTRLCNKWEMTGSCPYGNICRFAHGQAELKKPEGHIALVSGFMPTDTTTNLPTGKVGIWTTRGQQVQGRKFVFKSKTVEKLAGIYADWIEGTSFFA